MNAYYSKNGNLVVEIAVSGRRVMYKKETLGQNRIPMELAKMEASGYTVGGHSALEWLLAQVQPDQVLRKGWL